MLMTVNDSANMYDENSNNLMAMVNHLMNVKDSRWLQLEVCREFQRGQCTRSESECKFAHPPSYVEVQNGRVTACYDSIKGRCTRENPKCKYLHPPQHLKDQLLINGRQNLAIKNLLMTQMSTPPISTLGVAPLTVSGTSAIIPGVAAPANAYNPYAYALNTHSMYPGLVAANSDALGTVSGIINTATSGSPASVASVAQVQKAVATPRSDRVESMSVAAGLGLANAVAYASSKKRPLESSAANSSLLLAAAMMQNKRTAYDKGGVPVFQPVPPNTAAVGAMGAAFPYPQFAAIPGLQASYVPVTFSSPALASVSNGSCAARMVRSCSPSNVPVIPSTAASPLLTRRMPMNSSSIAYFDEFGQLLDTLPVCRDFKQGRCNRPSCRYVHLFDENVEISDEFKVSVCRDFTRGKCTRSKCKLYHPPLFGGSDSGGLSSPCIHPGFANINLMNSVASMQGAAAGGAMAFTPFPCLFNPTVPSQSVLDRMVEVSSLVKSSILNPLDVEQQHCSVVPSNAHSSFSSTYLTAQQSNSLLAHATVSTTIANPMPLSSTVQLSTTGHMNDASCEGTEEVEGEPAATCQTFL